MTKTDFITAVSNKTNINKTEADKLITAVFDVITEAIVSGDTVRVSGFGIFEVSERKGRTGRNPQTGEEIEIAASRLPKFKAAKALKDAVNA